MRKAAVRRERNRSDRSALRTVMKRARAAAAAAGTDAAAATEAVKLASKKLDQSAASHLIHKNAASRLKSRLARLLKKSAAAPTAPAKSTAAKSTAAK
jgi:small subunit ribosomal protein S20